MRARALLALALSSSLATSACTSKEMIPTAARYALAQTTTGDFIRLPTVSGGFVEVGPNATFTIDDEVVNAGELYWSDWGLFRKTGETIGRWDDIRSIRVEQLDGVGTVAVTATVAILVVALAALLKGGAPSGGSGSKGGGGGGGGGGAKAPSTHGSAPNPSPVIPDPRYTEVAFRTLEAVSSSTSQSPGVTVGTTDEDESTTATPLFARGARRRANIRALARLDGGACWPGSRGDCIVSGARVGVRLLDIFELTGGVRVESNAIESKAYAVFGAMLHGESPAAHWFALAVGASVAFDQTRAHVVPQLAARFRPFRNAGFWLGIVPVEPVYATDTDSWSMASGVEVTGEF